MKVKTEGYITMYVSAEFDHNGGEEDLRLAAKKALEANAREQYRVYPSQYQLDIWSVNEDR